MTDSVRKYPVVPSYLVSTGHLPESTPVRDAISSMYRDTIAAHQSSNQDVTAALAKGDYGRAAGASARQIVTLPLGFASDSIGRPVMSVVGQVGHFLGGLLGTPGTTEAAPVAAVKPAAPKAPAPNKPAAKTPPTEADLQQAASNHVRAAIESVLTGGPRPFSIDALTALSGAPQVAPTTRPTTPKEAMMGGAAELSNRIYASQLAQARELAKSDPEKGALAEQKATEAHFQRIASMAGAFNPQNYTMAQMFGTPGEVP